MWCLDRCVLEAAWKCPLVLMVHNLIFEVSDNHMPKGCVFFLNGNIIGGNGFLQ